MYDYEKTDTNSTDIDLSHSLDGRQQSIHKPQDLSPPVRVKQPASSDMISDNSGEEFGIPKFLLKNNTADAAAYEDDKFVNRSLKMVQEACKTLSDGDTGGPVDANSGTENAEFDLPPAKSSNWILPATFGVLAIGAGAFFFHQTGYLNDIKSFSNGLINPPTQIASGYGETSESANIVSDTRDITVTSWGALASEKNQQGQNSIIATSQKVLKLDNQQYASLKERLGTEQVAASTDAPKEIKTAADSNSTDIKRLQIAALVAEQAPEPSEASNSLKQVSRDALELEAGVNKSNTKITSQTPSNGAPVVPTIKLAQNSAGDETLKLLTNNVVTQLTKLKKFEENPSVSEVPETQDLRNSISQLVQQATSQNLDSNAIEGLLQEALENSDAVPAALARADGKLDTRLLIMSVLSQIDSSQVKSGDSDYLSALDDEGSSTVIRSSLIKAEKADIIENHRVKIIGGKKTIKIEVGDTLSKISFSVYGDALAYTRIFKANRKNLKNPNILTVGTVLLLP